MAGSEIGQAQETFMEPAVTSFYVDPIFTDTDKRTHISIMDFRSIHIDSIFMCQFNLKLSITRAKCFYFVSS